MSSRGLWIGGNNGCPLKAMASHRKCCEFFSVKAEGLAEVVEANTAWHVGLTTKLSGLLLNYLATEDDKIKLRQKVMKVMHDVDTYEVVLCPALLEQAARAKKLNR